MFNTIAVISAEANQDSYSNNRYCQGINNDSLYYEDMVNSMMETKSLSGRKRKITASTNKRTKRFKRSKGKK